MTQLRYMSAKDLANQRLAGEERRAWIRHQLGTGELVIRQATPEERRRYGIPATASARRTARRTVTPGGSAAR
jgi:hypothetical protein